MTRRLLAATALVLAGISLSGAPRTLADSSNPVFNAICTTGTDVYPVELEAFPARAFNPLHAVGGGVLVPFTIVLNGQTIQDRAPSMDGSAVSSSLTTCTFASGAGSFEVTGILTPPMA